MTNLVLSVFCALVFVAFSNAQQLSAGPKPLEDPSSLSMPQKLDKRYATRVITLYLTPSEMKALTEAKGTNSQILIQGEKDMQQTGIQNYNEQQEVEATNANNKNVLPEEEPKAELRGLLSHNAFYPKNDKSVYENQQWNYELTNLYSEQKPKDEQRQISYSDIFKNEQAGATRYQDERKTQDSATKEQSALQPYNPESFKENTVLYRQLNQQWNKFFDQNRDQSKALPALPNENQNQNIKETNTYSTAENLQLNSNNKEKSEVEKQIEAIHRQQQAFENGKQNYFIQAQSDNNRRPPIIIHKEISLTRHLPVPVLQKVKVPTPVLVPIPHPYEVKIPHPYPVPYKIVKHIPVPLVKNY